MVDQESPAWARSRISISKRCRSSREGTPHSVSWYSISSGPPLAQAQRVGTGLLDGVGVDAVLLELLAQGVPVDAEELGRAHLVALGLPHHRAQERLLHQPHHEPVEGGGGVAAEARHVRQDRRREDL